MELCNAYTELNDPVLQREAFAKQVIAGKLYYQFFPTLDVPSN
jgi:lysyl-tRNA synthetase class II